MGHGPRGHVRIPEPRHPGQEAAGIEVQVLLRVARQLPARGQQEGHVGQHDERDRRRTRAGAGRCGELGSRQPSCEAGSYRDRFAVRAHPAGARAPRRRRWVGGGSSRSGAVPGTSGIRGYIPLGGGHARADRLDHAGTAGPGGDRRGGALAPLRVPGVLLEPGRTGLPLADRRAPGRLLHHPDRWLSHVLPSVAGGRPGPLVLLAVHARMAAGPARGRRRRRDPGRRPRPRRRTHRGRDLPARTGAGRRPARCRCSPRW